MLDYQKLKVLESGSTSQSDDTVKEASIKAALYWDFSLPIKTKTGKLSLRKNSLEAVQKTLVGTTTVFKQGEYFNAEAFQQFDSSLYDDAQGSIGLIIIEAS